MKALSIRAPWWWLILHAGKDVENREWSTRYRGPLLLHASSWFNAAEIAGDIEAARHCCGGRPFAAPALAELRRMRGRIVGRARLDDCVVRSASPWFFGRYGFVLSGAAALPSPAPCKGALGLFDVEGYEP